MNFNLKAVRKYFGMHNREASGFLLMLLQMKKGDKFKSRLGEIVKLNDNKFEVNTNMAIQELSEIWTDEVKNPINTLFE